MRKLRVLTAGLIAVLMILSGTLTPGWADEIQPNASAEATRTTARAAPRLGNVWGPNQRGYGQIRPRRFYAGGSSTGDVYNVTWRTWGRGRATGVGTAYRIPPGGFGYQARPAFARILAYNLGNCNGRRAYRSVKWWFPRHGETIHSRSGGFRDICRDGRGQH